MSAAIRVLSRRRRRRSSPALKSCRIDVGPAILPDADWGMIHVAISPARLVGRLLGGGGAIFVVHGRLRTWGFSRSATEFGTEPLCEPVLSLGLANETVSANSQDTVSFSRAMAWSAS